jgi:nitroreductase
VDVELLEAVQKRKSIRDFKSAPVSRELLEKVLEMAVRAPSGVNRQPWEFMILSGEVLAKVKEKNLEMFQAGHKGHQGAGPPVAGASVYRKRQVDLAIQLFQLMEIEREDREGKIRWMERGFYYFNAPAVILLLTDRSFLLERVLLDIGAVMQTICLTALEFDLGTCIEGQGVTYPEVLREYGGVSPDKQIVMAIAIGYPNWSFPANAIETPRESIDKITSWRGFE